MIRITLTGRPLSVNHLYRASSTSSGRPFQYMTQEGKNAKLAWQLEAQHQFKKQRGTMFKEDNLDVRIVFHFENRRRHDLDNFLKAMLDCLSGVVWEDDKQIAKLTVEKRYVEKGTPPRTELVIDEIGDLI